MAIKNMKNQKKRTQKMAKKKKIELGYKKIVLLALLPPEP